MSDNRFVPDMEGLKKELGRQPQLPETKPEDFAPKARNSASRIAQAIKAVIHGGPRWSQLSDEERETLELIATNMSEILTDHATGHDAWADIAARAEEI